MGSLDVNILTLPEDVIIPIFRLLPQFEVLYNVRLTCKTWSHYSRDGILWRRIRAQDFFRASRNDRIENFVGFLCDISHSVEILEIEMEQIYILLEQKDILQKRHLFLPRLRSLKLCGGTDRLSCPIQNKDLDNSLNAITSKYPALEVLHVNISFTDFDMTCCPKGLKEFKVDCWTLDKITNYKSQTKLGEYFKNLTHLGLRWCTLNNQTVFGLLSGIPCLESIDLTCTVYKNNLTDDTKIPDEPCSKRIQKVVLNNTHLMFFPHVFFYILESAHESIRYIDISNSSQWYLISPCLHNIAEKCKQLDTLVIFNSDEKVPNQDKNGINRGIRDVASNNKHLSTIKMKFVAAIIDDETVSHVFQNCSKLQWIELLGCVSLSDSTLCNITNGEWLRVMKISKCQFVTPVGIGKALEICSRLRTLHVENIWTIKLISDRQSCQLINFLTTLSLAYCFELSDQCLDQIAKSCPILRSINFTCCCRITDIGFVQFVQQCASITEIVLNDSEEHKIGLTAHAFTTVANCQNNLERLTVGRFSKITYDAIHKLICKCPKLTEIMFCNRDRLWEFDVVITASKLDMTQAETQEFTKKIKRELKQLEKEDYFSSFSFVSTIRLHKDCLNRRNKEKLYANWFGSQSRY